MTDPNDTEAALGEARRKIAEVRAIHQQYRTAWVDWDTCAGCNQDMELVRWPCPTIRALDASPGDADREPDAGSLSLGEQPHDGTHCHEGGRPHLGPCIDRAEAGTETGDADE